MRARGAATTIRTRWQWEIAGEVVTFALASAPCGDLGEPLAPRRAFKRILAWFPPNMSSRAEERQFAEMAARVAQVSHTHSTNLDITDVATAVNEGRLLVFSNLCDATRSQARTVDRPLPEVTSLTGDLFALDPIAAPRSNARCEVVELDVVGYGRRKPDARQRLLQVVAMPDALTSDALTDAGAINKTARQVRDLISVVRRARDRKSRASLMRSFDRAQRGHEEDGGPEVGARWTRATSGHALLDVRPRNDSPCRDHRQFLTTSGVTTRMTANQETVVRLTYGGVEPVDVRSLAVRPTRRSIGARGCHGEGRAVAVEVFPGAQRIFSYEFSEEDDGPTLLKGALSKLLGELGVECHPEFGGSVETFEGWRDCDGDWRVENVAEITSNVSFSLHAAVTLSLLKYALAVPTSLSDLLGDLRFKADFFVGLEVEGRACLTDRPVAGDAPAERKGEGAFEVTLKGGVELSVEARLGNDVLGASATGSATPEVRGSARATFEGERLVGKLTAKIAECELSVEVCTRALVWERRSEWHFPFWEEHELWSAEYEFYPRVCAVEGAS